MAKFSDVKLDVDAEQNGVWKDWSAGIRLKIARTGNPNYAKEVQSLSKPFLTGFRKNKIPPKDLEDIQKKAMAKHVLVDWENVEDDNGNPLPYDWEIAYKYFCNPAYSNFYQFVLIISNSEEEYREKLIKKSAKNSQTASSGG